MAIGALFAVTQPTSPTVDPLGNTTIRADASNQTALDHFLRDRIHAASGPEPGASDPLYRKLINERDMTGFEFATAVFAGISALSDLINLAKAVRGRPISSGEIDKTVSEAKRKAQQKPEASRNIQKIIGDNILSDIKKNIDKELERLEKSLTDPANDNAARDKAIDIANSTICGELLRIKRLNMGDLPDSECERFWLSHSCASSMPNRALNLS
jgi:hypothetical protein